MPDSESKAKVLLIGYGYWGKKLAKTLHKLGVLGAVWDQNSEAREAALKDFPGIQQWLDDTMAIPPAGRLPVITHAVIATPPETHADLASDTLKAGLHTFVEKPLATTREHALVLEDLARKVGRNLNTGHIYLHNPGLLYMANGRRPFIGPVRIDIQLLNVGAPPSQSTRDLMWAGMPHAISVGLYLTGQRPSWIQQTSHDSSRYRNWFGAYLNGTEVHVTVADYAGVRRRLVRVEDSHMILSFNADRPFEFQSINKLTGQVQQPEMILENPRDPLTLEMEAFLRGEPDKVRASDVVAVIEESIRAWEQNQQKP